MSIEGARQVLEAKMKGEPRIYNELLNDTAAAQVDELLGRSMR